MPPFKIKEVHVDEGADAYPLTQEILSRLKGGPTVGGRPGTGEVPFAQGKEQLHLLPFRGAFLKPCPGTRGYICCGYQILNVGTNCPLDCSYCILQSYFFHQPQLRVFVNLEEALEEVVLAIHSQPERIFRIGTGEFTDSLALDPLTRWSGLLLRRFAETKNAVIEFKTKTDRIDGLFSTGIRERIVVSWSLNSPLIAGREEKRAPGLQARLKAARRCQAEGFVVGFHFDPMIHYPGWQEDYEKTLDMMDRYIDPKGILWISLGSFRFMPGLRDIVRKRHPHTQILRGEFVPGLDGKMRYFKPIRIDLYARMREMLEMWRPQPGLYLCMESDEIWRKSLGWSPGDSAGLSRHLDRRVREVFGSNP